MTLQLYLRDTSRRRIGEIDDYKSFSVTTKHTGVGAWNLIFRRDNRLAQYLNSGVGLIALDENGLVVSGPYSSPNVKDDGQVRDLQLSGHDDQYWLSTRNALPCSPNYAGAPFIYDDEPYDEQTGKAETVAKHYVSFALGEDALVSRQLPGLVIAPDFGRGLEVAQQARFDPLNELLSSIALAGGDLGYSIKQYVNGYDETDLVFDIVEPTDKTSFVRFSRSLGNLGKYEYEDNRPEFNYLRVAGGGEGVGRAFVEGGDAASIEKWGLIEGPLRDRRDTTELAQLEQTLYEDLVAGASKLSLSIEPKDTQFLKYGVHWGLHDRVTVEVDGEIFTGIVREVTRTWSQDKPSEIRVVVGTPESVALNVPRLFIAQKRVAARTAQLERRV